MTKDEAKAEAAKILDIGSGESMKLALLVSLTEQAVDEGTRIKASEVLRELREAVVEKSREANLPSRLIAVALMADLATMAGMDFFTNGPRIGDETDEDRFNEGFNGALKAVEFTRDAVRNVNLARASEDATKAA